MEVAANAVADVAICIVKTSPDFAGRMARGIGAIDNLRVSSIMDAGVDFVFTKLRPVAELGLVLRRLGRPDAG